MSGSTRIASVLLIVSGLCAGIVGCVTIDYAVNQVGIRDANSAAGAADFLKDRADLPDDIRKSVQEKRLCVGMDKETVRFVAGEDQLDVSHNKRWLLKRQQALFTPGLYSYFDTRRVTIYFDEKTDLVSALILRGCYNVYP